MQSALPAPATAAELTEIQPGRGDALLNTVHSHRHRASSLQHGRGVPKLLMTEIAATSPADRENW